MTKETLLAERGSGCERWAFSHAVSRMLVLSSLFITVWIGGSGAAESDLTKDLRPMQGFKYPLEIHENGRVKTQIVAGEVIPSLAQGEIRARKVRLEFFDEAGKATGLLTVDTCAFYREKGLVKSDAEVRLDKDGIVITGKGFEWTIKEQRIIILSQVRIVLARAPGRQHSMVSPSREQGNEGAKNAE